MEQIEQRYGPITIPGNPVRFGLSKIHLALISGLLLVLYWETGLTLFRQWGTDPNFSHGYFVPLFTAYLLWQRRGILSLIPLRPSWWGLPVLAAGIAMFVVGTLGSEYFVSRVSILAVTAGTVIFLAGWNMFRAVLFPWAVLLLAVPIPGIVFYQVTVPLQLLASSIAGSALQSIGVPVMREGNIIVLPQMRLEVAEACSGIRSLMTLSTLAVIYGFFVEKNRTLRVLLFVVSIPIAVAANAIRVFGTGLLVHYWDAQKALGFFHEFSGWVIFLVSLAMLVIFHRMMDLSKGRTQP